MKELKPKLIIADSGRRRRGSGGVWSFLAFLIVFAVGVYVGTKLDEYGFTDGEEPTVEESGAANETRTEETYAVKEMDTGDAEADVSVYSGDEDVAASLPAEVVNEGPGYGGEALTDPTVLESARDGADSGARAGAADPVEGDGGGVPEETVETVGYRYTLQIAAFAEPEDARKAADDYRSKGYNAYTVQVENSRGEKWNLVKIGKYGSIERAWNESALFRRREGKDAYVETLSKDTAVNESWNQKDESGR